VSESGRPLTTPGMLELVDESPEALYDLPSQWGWRGGLSMVVVDHPLGAVSDDVILARASAIVDDVLRLRTR
jgi:hypothetical protein